MAMIKSRGIVAILGVHIWGMIGSERRVVCFVAQSFMLVELWEQLVWC